MSILRSSLILIFAAALTASGAGAASTHKKSSARAASHAATNNASDGASHHKTHSDDAPAASSRKGTKHSDDAPATSSKARGSDDASAGTRKSRKTGSADKPADAQTASHKPCRSKSRRCKAAASTETASSDTTSGSSDSSTSSKSRRRTTAASAPAKPRLHGQQAISTERVTEIQQALIRQHYLNKEADGRWDGETEAAMQKFQADQGWQTKLMPDSRALMKLGLGPDYSNAINAKTGNFAPTTIPGNLTPDQTAGFTAGSGISR